MLPEPFPEDPSIHRSPGMQVGPWRIVERQGSGAYGIVYRALRVGSEHSGPVALKLARYAWDPRFAREAELLSRLHHPSVPRLLGHGLWRLPSGAEHPYLVMEWVEGLPLYDWVEQQGLISAELLDPFAQLARALAATHAAQAVHRDVKGDNMRVRLSDGRAFLIDFGSAHFQGASRLTWGGLPPSTVAYRSPAACLFYLRSARSPDSWFEATPADDLFSLGVTLYRLATGRYPPELEPRREKGGEWYLVREDLRPLLAKHPRLDPLLREWLLRLLSLTPEERGTAAELAEALEAPVAQVRAPALPKTAPPRPVMPARELAPPKPAMRRAPARSWRPWRALAAVSLCALFVWALQSVHLEPEGLSEDARQASSSSEPEAGAAVGDSSPPASLASVHPPSEQETVAQELPPQPRPGQARPDEKGQCLGRNQVALNGACWLEDPLKSVEECTEGGYTHYRGKCYFPAFPPPKRRPPTSNPADAR